MMAKPWKSRRESTWLLGRLSCLAWCNLFEKERTMSKVIYYFIIKKVRYACKEFSWLLKKRALKFLTCTYFIW